MTQHSAPSKRELAQAIRKNRHAISEWYSAHAQMSPPPFYCSVDLRDSGHKIVPVDSNLFPAGFNNICPDDLRTAPSVLKSHLTGVARALGRAEPRRVLIIPESHTSNRYYIENLWYLQKIIEDAGFEVRVGWYGPMPEGASAPLRLLSITDKEVLVYPLEIQGGVASAGGFVPDLVLLNNDFSSGYPRDLDSVTQPVLPSHVLGWHSRKKSEHFVHYNRLAAEFAQIIGIDPWFVQVDTEEVPDVNLNEDQGTDRVADAVERVLARTQAQYDRHGIRQRPFAFVKNNHGTYGMGIMVAHSADEIRKMNRRAKNKMSVGKNRLPIDSLAIQEGVPTATLVDRLAAEPVIYLVGCELIGGFLRTNTERGTEDNLNSQGMVFKKLCMSDLRNDEEEDEDSEEELPILELVYGAIARISALATGLEFSARSRPQPPSLTCGAPALKEPAAAG